MAYQHPVFGCCTINNKGYYKIKRRGPYRDKYLHRAVFELVAGRPVKPGYHVHHQNFDKLCCCPWNLIEMPAEFNPRSEPIRNPNTGRFITAEQLDKILYSEPVPF